MLFSSNPRSIWREGLFVTGMRSKNIINEFSLPSRERVRVRGYSLYMYHPHLNPLPSREREFVAIQPLLKSQVPPLNDKWQLKCRYGTPPYPHPSPTQWHQRFTLNDPKVSRYDPKVTLMWPKSYNNYRNYYLPQIQWKVLHINSGNKYCVSRNIVSRCR